MYTNKTLLDEILIIPRYKRYLQFFFIFVFSLVIVSFYPYRKTKNYVATTNSNHSLSITIPIKDIENIDEKTLYIKEKKYAFQIQKIEVDEKTQTISLLLYTQQKLEKGIHLITIKNKITTIGKEVFKIIKKGCEL